MLEFMPFKAEHLRYLTPQAEQRRSHAVILASNFGAEMEANFSLSAWEGHKCIAAAGCVPIFNHRAVAWAMLSTDAAPHMLAIVRRVRKAIDMLPYRRIEISVQVDFEAGHRFAKLIGMELETPTPMRAHGANGNDEMQYAVVKTWQS